MDSCFYCGMPAVRFENDHFPTPRRQGGTDTVVACLNCHDLKDRTILGDWDATSFASAFLDLWEKASPLQRILIAKMTALVGES